MLAWFKPARENKPSIISLMSAGMMRCAWPYRFKDHPALRAWDVINEPEWGIDETYANPHRDPFNPWINTVPLVKMQQFVARCTAAIHEHAPGVPVTVGSNSLEFSWPFGDPIPDQ